MRRKKSTKIHNNVELPPPPPLFDKEGFIKKINQRLVDLKSGNYLIKLIDLKSPRRNWISYEHHYDQIIQITDLNDPKRKFGVIVPGMGPKPIELNKDREMLPNNFFDFWDFENQLWERISRWQKNINEEGYYARDEEPRKGMQRR